MHAREWRVIVIIVDYAFNSQETFGGVISLHSIFGPKMDSAKESISMREGFVLI